MKQILQNLLYNGPSLEEAVKLEIAADLILEDGGKTALGWVCEDPQLAAIDNYEKAAQAYKHFKRYDLAGTSMEKIGDIQLKRRISTPKLAAREAYQTASDYFGRVNSAEAIRRVQEKMLSLNS